MGESLIGYPRKTFLPDQDERTACLKWQDSGILCTLNMNDPLIRLAVTPLVSCSLGLAWPVTLFHILCMKSKGF